ncbi:MAG: OmpA family protein [Sporichthyaceae bacterium]
MRVSPASGATVFPLRRRLVLTPTAVIVLAGLVSGCGGDADAAGISPNPTAAGQAAAIVLTQAQRSGCATTLAFNPVSPANLAVVVDLTRSNVNYEMPQALAEQIRALSLEGGSVTVIGVDGAGAAPRVILDRAGLSPEKTGEDRTAPSVTQTAEFIPTCVAAWISEQTRPTADGTDLYPALKAAAEAIDENTRSLWVHSDFQINVGPMSLMEQDLSEVAGAGALASTLVATAPLDLGGVPFYATGVANTLPALAPRARDWTAEFARSLCLAWKAEVSSCAQITTKPAAAERNAPADLPGDDPLPFPAVAAVSMGTRCQFTVPGALTFTGDTATVRPDGAASMTAPLALLQTNPGATAMITGHTASSAARSTSDLLELSRARAEATKGLLVTSGIAVERIQTEGVADTQPLSEDIDPISGQQIPHLAAAERRVTITVEGVPCRG